MCSLFLREGLPAAAFQIGPGKEAPTDDSTYKNRAEQAQPQGKGMGRGYRVGTMAADMHSVKDVQESDGCTAECYEMACFMWVRFIICELYPNKNPTDINYLEGKTGG